MSMLCMPLHTVTLLSPLSQAQQVGVIDQQPVAGVDVFLGWGKDVPYLNLPHLKPLKTLL